MKRRLFMRALAALPAGPAVFAQQRPTRNSSQAAIDVKTLPKFEPAIADNVATGVPRFFTADQFATLRKLSDVLLPPMNRYPGALLAGAPEFLDFHVGASSPERQRIYRDGLDDLNRQALNQFQKSFAELDPAQADSILRPMFKPTPEDRSSVSAGPFVNRVHQDIRTLTMNSPQWAEADASMGRRPSAGIYWRRVDPTVMK